MGGGGGGGGGEACSRDMKLVFEVAVAQQTETQILRGCGPTGARLIQFVKVLINLHGSNPRLTNKLNKN